jgi:hypothetical protein
MRLLLLALGSALMTIATVVYLRHGRPRREYAARSWTRRTSEPTTGNPARALWVTLTEGDDGVQPWDVPVVLTPLPDIGTGYPELRPDPRHYEVWYDTGGNDNWTRSHSTGLT